MTSDEPITEQSPPVAPELSDQPLPTDTTGAISKPAWDRAVGTWIDEHVRSSPIAQGTTGAWEHLNTVLPRLRELLEHEIKG